MINFFVNPMSVIHVVSMLVGVFASDWLDGKQSNAVFSSGNTEPLIA